MKTLFWIIVIVLVLSFIYIFLRLSAARLSFRFSLNDISFDGLNLSDFQSDKAHVGVNVNSTVTNLNSFDINFSGLEVWLYHNNVLVAKSSSIGGLTRLKGGAMTTFVEPLDLFISPGTLKLAALLKLKQKVKIDYQVKVKVFGIPVPKINDNFIVNG